MRYFFDKILVSIVQTSARTPMNIKALIMICRTKISKRARDCAASSTNQLNFRLLQDTATVGKERNGRSGAVP